MKNSRCSSLFSGLPILLFALFASLPTCAQVAGGTILGTVTDNSGALVSNAQVQVKDLATDGVRRTVTSSVGFFAVPNLVPGEYQVIASVPGFKDAVVSALQLTVGAQRSVTLVLVPTGQTETVDVNSIATGVDLASSAISAEVDDTTVRNLPLNGRDWASLATLEPGVDTVRNQSPVGGVSTGDVVRALRGFGNQLSISGARPQQNNYRLDGISINDYTNGAPGGVLGSLSGVDAIQEFSILTTNYSAEYGQTSGGIINAVTRSGTNALHGSAYEFLRNSALDARNYFDGPTIPPFRRNQFGASAGGPLIKDRVFWFFNYEGLRQSLTGTQVDTVPSQNARNGILSTGNVAVNPNVIPYLAIWPLPNGALNPGGDTGIYTVQTGQVGSENFYAGRVDFRLSQRDSLSSTFGYDQTSLTEPDPLNTLHFLDSNSRPYYTIEETHTFNANLVNSVRFGFNRNRAESTTANAINPLAADLSYGTVPGRPAAEIAVAGLTNFNGGIGGFPNFEFGWNTFQVYDDAFLTRGTHSIKFGGVVERMQSNNRLNFSDNGGFNFSSLANFLTNAPQVYFMTIPGTATERGIRQTLTGVYLQDDWRFRPTLTLNLGVRYERVNVPTEVEGKLAVLRNITDTVAHLGNPYFNNPTNRNFEPRIGIAWDPFGKGTTVIRSGFGFFDVLPLTYQFVILSSASAPFAANTALATLPAGSFPSEAFNLALAGYTPGSLAGQRVSYIAPSPNRSYVMQWNLNIQQELARNVTGLIAYVGSRGVHLPFRTDDSNIVLPVAHTSAGYVWPNPVGSGMLLNPFVSEEDRLVYGADSYYNALQLGSKISDVHGLSLQASFTWGKTIDTGSSTIAGDQFSNSPSSLPFWFFPRLRRGQSDFNLSKNFVVSGTYNVPHPDVTGFAGWASSGWQLGGILEASTGAPFTVVMAGDALGLNSTDPWDYPNRLSGPGCSSLVNPGNPTNYIKTQCFTPATAPSQAFYKQFCDPAQPYPTCINLLGNSGRNPLTGPGLVNTDFSIFKNNRLRRISESANLEFRAEFFNLFNRANFAPPLDNNALFNPVPNSIGGTSYAPVANAGQIDRTQTASRQIQFGLKLLW
jgi:outer membrane receptor protein involved in Fe transport